MTLEEFLALPEEHSISFEDGRELHHDICSKGIDAFPDDQRERLRDYLERALLHESIEPHLRSQLEAYSAALA